MFALFLQVFFRCGFRCDFGHLRGGSAAQAGVAGKGKGSSQKPVLEGSGMI